MYIKRTQVSDADQQRSLKKSRRGDAERVRPYMHSPSPQHLLHENVENFYRKFFEKHGASMSCKQGCCRCCHVDLSVFESEAYVILSWFEALPASEKAEIAAQWQSPEAPPSADAAGNVRSPCSFLHEGLCSIYTSRPLICRSQGVPMLFRANASGKKKGKEGKNEVTDLQVDACPLNFQTEFPPQAEWLDLDRLNVLQSLAASAHNSHCSDKRLAPLKNSEGRISLRKLRTFLFTLV